MSEMNMNPTDDQTLGAPANDQQMPATGQQNANTGAPQDGSQEMLGATQPQDAGAGSNLQKDPDEWATGDEPMTEAQKSYLDTLAKEAGETLPATLTKAEASKHIERLQGASNRVDGGQTIGAQNGGGQGNGGQAGAPQMNG